VRLTPQFLRAWHLELFTKSSLRRLLTSPSKKEAAEKAREKEIAMRIAILDDYFNAALRLADWSPLSGRAEIQVFTEPLGGEENAAKRLADFKIIVGMRERTPFPGSLIGRLPKLKLLITTGMRNLSFDLEAARAQGVMLCGTGLIGNATSELAVGLMIALMRDIAGQFGSMRRGGWQTRPGYDLAGKTLGLLGLGRVGGGLAASSARGNWA